MSAHAIHARRDLSDLFVLFLELLEPLFLFLLDGRRAVGKSAPVAGDGSPLPSASGVPANASAPSVPVADGPSVEIPQKADAGEVAEGVPVLVLADAREVERCGNRRPAATDGGAVFAKVGGRFRLAPDGYTGPVFERVRSSGGRVTYRPLVA